MPAVPVSHVEYHADTALTIDGSKGSKAVALYGHN